MCKSRYLVVAGTVALLELVSRPLMAAETSDIVANDTSKDELQEIIVTAERRTEDVQRVGATVTVLQAQDLQQQGRTSVQQMIEDVPNVTFGQLQPGQQPDNPTNNISIRGIQSVQQTGGRPGPAVVGTYVDDVFQGIGQDYDLNHVEVLYGPQGTLYGRSATAGVIAFHTNDPVLGQFGADAYAEYASNDLRNGTAVLNLPFGDQFALRAAVHEDDTHGYWWNTYGGASQTTEGRVKLLYQPTDNLRILLSASGEYLQTYSGGPQQSMVGRGVFDYQSPGTAVSPVAGNQYAQYMANVTYNFGPATLTYVGSEHSYRQSGFQGQVGPGFMPIFNFGSSKPDQFNMHELRLASNADAPLSWLAGVNFFSNIYSVQQESIVQSATQCGPCGIPDTTPGVDGGEIFANGFVGSIKDYAAFTQETWAVTDALRLTAGLRYDHSEVQQETFYDFNLNLDQYGQSLGTCSNLVALAGATPVPCQFSDFNDQVKFNNLTYKARLEYDLAPQNMLYAMVSSGYLPGDVQVTPHPSPAGVTYLPFTYAQERLTSYELGSKNRLFDNRLQLNGDLFYYNYQGFQQIAQLGNSVGGAPIFAQIAVPLRVIGAEISANWLLTPSDRLTLNAGYFDDEISSWPMVAGTGETAQFYLIYKRLPGSPSASGTVSYDHTFHFGNGSTLVPHAELRWSGAERVIELSQTEVTNYPILAADNEQSAYTVLYANLTWTSPEGKYGVTAYGRNLGNKAAALYGNVNQSFYATIPLEPRVFGVSARVHF